MIKDNLNIKESVSMTLNGKPVEKMIDIRKLLIHLTEMYNVPISEIEWFSWPKNSEQIYAFVLPIKINVKFEKGEWVIWSGRFGD